jgi:RNA polymerase sigma factor (sigma-70 family)
MKPLTDDERDLVAQNIGLAFAAARRFRGGMLDFDERLELAFFGLIAAAQQWDPERSAFSTFGYCCALSALRTAARNMTRPGMASIYAKAEREGLADVPGPADRTVDLIDREELLGRVAWALDGLPIRTQEVIRRRANGETHLSIGEAMGVKRQRVHQIAERGYEAIREMLA